MSDPKAQENFNRFRYGYDRGHYLYQAQARLCERMYLGGGRQWDPVDLQILNDQRRPAYEFNEVLPSVNSALGYQISNRLDIAFRPRGGMADQKLADLHTKLVMQICDQNRLHWKESEVFADGLIQQRGFYEVRVHFDQNMQGSIVINVLDPMDVIPDPDSKTYEPSGWADVVVTRWLTSEEVEANYGQAKRLELEAMAASDSDWGEDSDDTGQPRAKFGDRESGRYWQARYTEGGIVRHRVVDRQRWVHKMSKSLYYPRTGDLKMAENLPDELVAAQVAQGAQLTRAMAKRVRWTVSTAHVLLHDDDSPYARFTIIPYFAYFRRGQTIGLIDNAIGPQQAVNKALSQYVHIVNTSANSGWKIEENSLANLTAQELQTKGAMTGLVLEFKKGSTEPKKIEPNPVPQGIERLIGMARDALKSVTVPDAMRGIDGPATSGIARQAQQFAGQQQIAVPLDNLARTRHMLAETLLELEQQFYTEERVLRITEQDPQTGRDIDSEVPVNVLNAQTGAYDNDLTVGSYDAVISEQPTQVTFENSQFQQALELRKVGVAVPDTTMLRHSTLSRKEEVIQQMQSQAGQADPLTQAKVGLLQAQMKKTVVEAVSKAVEAMFSATQAANQVAAVPQVAGMADQMLRSAGFEDQDAAPIVPQPQPGLPALPAANPMQPVQPVQPVHANTSPNFPARTGSAAAGVKDGIETADSAAGVPA